MHEIKKNLIGAPIKERQWASPIFFVISFFFAPIILVSLMGAEFGPSRVNLGHLEVHIWSVVGEFGLC